MTLLDEPSLIEELDAQLLFKEARQRRRRLRMVRSIFVVVVLAAVIVVGFELHVIPGPGANSYPLDSQSPLASGDGSGATLVYGYKDLRVTNADTGASRSLPLPAPEGGSSDLSMVRIGGSLLLNRGNTAWLYRPGLHGPPVNLGPSLRVIPGPTANDAWIWSDPCGATVGCGDNGLQQGELRLVDSSGNEVGSPISLPGDATWFPTGDVVNAGLVLAIASIGPDAEEIWNPITNHVVRILHGAYAVSYTHLDVYKRQTQDPAATDTVRQGLSTGLPVAGSTRWWAGRPSRVQWRRPTPDVARPPLSMETVVSGTESTQTSAIPTQKPPAGACPATAMSPPSETRTPQPSLTAISQAARSAAQALAVAPRSSSVPGAMVSVEPTVSRMTDRQPGTGPGPPPPVMSVSIREKSQS